MLIIIKRLQIVENAVIYILVKDSCNMLLAINQSKLQAIFGVVIYVDFLVGVDVNIFIRAHITFDKGLFSG